MIVQEDKKQVLPYTISCRFIVSRAFDTMLFSELAEHFFHRNVCFVFIREVSSLFGIAFEMQRAQKPLKL
jgi:hypothetical protein